MSRAILVEDVGEWLIDQALSSPDIVEMFSEVCHRLHAVGIPLVRARLTWPTLHPLFTAETILWTMKEGAEFEQFRHQEDASEAWKASPMAYMFENDLDELRRHITGPNKLIDFPIIEELFEAGMTDYLMIMTSFDESENRERQNARGVIVSWSSDRDTGFSEDDLIALKKIQRRLATACKSVVQERIARNITETYLGRDAGGQVLEGKIRLGDGHETQAVVWYTDMRDSTRLADTMDPKAFIALLNRYFEATAGSAIAHGGEVLDFIGDAVLAIFPFETDEERRDAIRRATTAMRDALRTGKSINDECEACGETPMRFGLGMNVGRVMFGNIGVASRLSFSVIGPTVNEVERIETLTKETGFPVLVSPDIAAVAPDQWESIGHHQLAGMSHTCELFGLREYCVDRVEASQPERLTA